MKKHLMPMSQFDQSRIGKQVLYIFPWPHGLRCIAQVDYDPVEEEAAVKLYNTEDKAWPDIADFVPDVSKALGDLYRPLFDEPTTGTTTNGRQTEFPSVVFDLILHDRAAGPGISDGSADKTLAALDDYDLIGAPTISGTSCAVILCAMFTTEFTRGGTRSDLWQQRAWLQRGLNRMGMRNATVHPRPILREMCQSPRQWSQEGGGIASDLPHVNWAMIENTFNRSFRGALVVDVWQPWAVNGTAFKTITADEVEI